MRIKRHECSEDSINLRDDRKSLRGVGLEGGSTLEPTGNKRASGRAERGQEDGRRSAENLCVTVSMTVRVALFTENFSI